MSAALAVMTTDEAADSLIPFPLEQDLLELFDDKVQFEERCTAEPDESSHDICPAGDLESPETVVLFGDSHMNMWSPGFDRVAQRVGVRVVPLIKFGCTPVDLTILRVDVNRPYDECAAWREWARQQIDNLSPAAVVVASHTQFQALDDTGAVLKGAVRNRVWRAGVRSTARSLAPLADQVRFLGDLTYLDTSPADCLSRRGATIGDCTVSTSRTVRVMDALMRQGVRGTGARVVPLTEVLCSAGQCPLVAAGRSVYRDVTHVSASWAEYAGAALWDDLALELAAERSP